MKIDYSKDSLLDDFAKMYSSYEYIIKTSRNHQKEKVWKCGTVRQKRDKFHVFFPITELGN